MYAFLYFCVRITLVVDLVSIYLRKSRLLVRVGPWKGPLCSVMLLDMIGDISRCDVELFRVNSIAR